MKGQVQEAVRGTNLNNNNKCVHNLMRRTLQWTGGINVNPPPKWGETIKVHMTDTIQNSWRAY